MFKKYTLFTFLGVLAVLTLSAFGPVSFRPATGRAYSPAQVSFRNPALSNSDPSNDPTNFRIAHTWNGISIPSVNVTAALELAAFAASSPGDNFRIAHIWNGIRIPSMDVTATLAAPGKSQSAPLSEIFALFPVPQLSGAAKAVIAPRVVAQQYQYGPFSLATGFAAPRKWNSGH
jgi:hypothetical protein